MCDDFRGMRAGFPDLMHVREGKVFFLEVSRAPSGATP
ncbi:hypothetical protein ABIB83_008961 [Bradyrhizobium sp. I1.8.5]